MMRRKIWVETNDPRYEKSGYWRKIKASNKPQKTVRTSGGASSPVSRLGSSGQPIPDRPPNLELLQQGAWEASHLIERVKPYLGDLPSIENAQLALPDLSDLNPKLADSIASDIKTLYDSMPKTHEKTAFESLYLYNATTGNKNYNPGQENYTGVAFHLSEVPNLVIYDPSKELLNNSFISLHNHPESGAFSSIDYSIYGDQWFNKDMLFVSVKESKALVVDAYGNSFTHEKNSNYIQNLEKKVIAQPKNPNPRYNPLEASKIIKEMEQHHKQVIKAEDFRLASTIKDYNKLITTGAQKDIQSLYLLKIISVGSKYDKEALLYKQQNQGAFFDSDLKKIVDTARFITAQLIGVNLQSQGIIKFNSYLTPEYQNIDQKLTRLKEYIMSQKENKQRHDSAKQFDLTPEKDNATLLTFDGEKADEYFREFGRIVSEGIEIDDIEPASAREDSKKKIWVETKDPRYKKGGYWRKVDVSNEPAKKPQKSSSGASRTATARSTNDDLIERRKQEAKALKDKENKGEALFLKNQVQRAFGVTDLSIENNAQLSLPNMNELYPDSATRKALMGKIAEYYLGMPKESNQLSPENFYSVNSTGGKAGQEIKGELTQVSFFAKNFPDYLSKDSYGSDQEMKERVIERTLFDSKYNSFTHPPVVTLHNHPVATPFSIPDHFNPFLSLYDVKDASFLSDFTKKAPPALFSAEQESYMVVDNFGNTYHGKPTDRFRSLVLPEKDRFSVTDSVKGTDKQYEANTERHFKIKEKTQKVLGYYFNEYEKRVAKKLITSARLEDADFEQLSLPSKVALKAIDFFRNNMDMYYDDDNIKKSKGKLPSKEIADIMQLGCFFEQHLQNAYLDEADIVKYTPTLTPFHAKLVRQIQELEIIAKKEGKLATSLSNIYLDSKNSTPTFIMDTPENPIPKKPFITNKQEQDELAEKYGKMSGAKMLQEMIADAEKGKFLIDRVILNDNFAPLHTTQELMEMPEDTERGGITSADIADAVRQAEAYRAGIRDVELGLIPNLLSPEQTKQIFDKDKF